MLLSGQTDTQTHTGQIARPEPLNCSVATTDGLTSHSISNYSLTVLTALCYTTK